jgi:type I restriction enzyme S subunit
VVDKNFPEEHILQEKPLPLGWTYIKFLESVRKISLTNKKLKQSDYLEHGSIPVVDQGQSLIGGYTDRSDLQIVPIDPVIIFGDHTRVVKFINFQFVAGAEGVKPFYVQPWFNPKFLFYFIQVADLPDKGYARHFQYLEKISLPLPPLPEQPRIVAKIEELFTQLDAGIASLKKAQAQLKRYRQAVLKAAFQGRLTQEWREEHKGDIEPADKLLDKIIELQKNQKKKNPKIDYSVTPHQQLPDKWIWCSSSDIFEFVTSGSRWWAKYYSDEGALFIRIGNLTRDSISINLDDVQKVTPQDVAEMKRTRLLENDILVSITADLGSIGLIPNGIGEAYINQHIALCRPVKQMNPKYIAWYFRSESGGNKQLLSFQRGATKKGLGLDDIKSVNIPLCSLKEQDLVVSEIERHFSQIDHLENTISTSLLQAESLRQSILKRAFEGKLVPQDPNDEPASILLERIKAEKALHATGGKKGKAHQHPSQKKKVRHAN